MIDLWFIAGNFGLPGLGGFIGSMVAQYVYCPNRGCCQMKKIKELIEE